MHCHKSQSARVTPKEIRRELKKMADGVGVQLNECLVCYEWSERGNSWNKCVSYEFITRLYSPIRTPSNNTLSLKATIKQHIHIIS